ncbi:neocarzinostatin apoprotein domain-containing protein [Nocardioides jishulii]|uniref:neocarzinostatin apoprotein domain-containing protein n=1 Tax=Nocardioides jishulii TaxID=2575440 RepID=UPI001485A6D8|nr:neocarzinostatin apoprotein domain-containing protein [Nocardioides jishulii]
MRKTPKKLSKALISAVALFFVTFVAAPPAFASATLDISATQGLKDGQQVTISGSGFKPGLKSIAIGQCIDGMKGPSDCNTAGGATFVDADASGKIPTTQIVVKEKFGSFDCTKQKCVIGAQPLPNAVDAATVAANTFYSDITFGEVAAAPAPSAAPAPTAGGENLPKTGPGDELATIVFFGVLLFLLGGATLWFTPRRGRGIA